MDNQSEKAEGAADPSRSEAIFYYDRSKEVLCEETVLGDGFIRWAYNSLSGKCFSPLHFKISILSRLLGWFFDSSLSRGRINPVIEHLGIDMSEVQMPEEKEDLDPSKAFKSFNDFFYRHLKSGARPFSKAESDLVSPADGRVLVYPELGKDDRIQVKGGNGTLSDLFGEPMKNFEGGAVCVVRLCPADYHRYHFPCDGKVLRRKEIKGDYHSVNPVALEACEKVFLVNKRSFSIIDTSSFGQMAYMEVGAFGVAGIVETSQSEDVKKMEEKGYFKFGGSTVVLVFEKDKVKFSDDLVGYSSKGIETLVKVGETIATTV